MSALIKAIITAPGKDPMDCLQNVLRVELAAAPHYQCKTHGEVLGYFEIYDKKICGICAANAIEKFIGDMND